MLKSQPIGLSTHSSNLSGYVIFDVCHMLKLMCNLLGHYKIIAHTKRDQTLYIKWEYIDYLNSIQEDLGFNFANKLKKKYLCWEKHKMNVKLAAQTLSASVASAIEFVRAFSKETDRGNQNNNEIILLFLFSG